MILLHLVENSKKNLSDKNTLAVIKRGSGLTAAHIIFVKKNTLENCSWKKIIVIYTRTHKLTICYCGRHSWYFHRRHACDYYLCSMYFYCLILLQIHLHLLDRSRCMWPSFDSFYSLTKEQQQKRREKNYTRQKKRGEKPPRNENPAHIEDCSK